MITVVQPGLVYTNKALLAGTGPCPYQASTMRERQSTEIGRLESQIMLEGFKTGAMAENGEFSDFSCSYMKRFVRCDAASSQKYIIINIFKTWREAERYCRLYYTDLVSVRNLEENLQVRLVIGPEQTPFTGLFKDNFTWSDSSSSSFRYWASDQPTEGDVSEYCVGLDVSRGEWTCVNCTSTIPFFCYTVKKRLILKVEVHSNQNVNDPADKMAILEKIQQEMKDHGMAVKTKLTWKQQPDGNVFHKKKLSTNAN
ncbi:hypothetical protein AOLI_G00194630 [Acnodon oligacanthus]